MDTLKLFDLSGRRALVTGSSRGIGLELARGLAGAGAEVVLNGLDEARLAAAVETLSNDGAVVHELGFDVTDAETAAAAIDGLEARVGAIDILVNNAGMQFRTPLEDFPVARFDELLRLNVNAAFYVGQALKASSAIRAAFSSVLK